MEKRTFVKICIGEEDGYLPLDSIKAMGEDKGGNFFIIVEDQEIELDKKTFDKLIKLFNIIDLTVDEFITKEDMENKI